MEQKNEKEIPKIPIIFDVTVKNKMGTLLNSHGKWLIRESEGQPGLLTISYYSQNKNKILHVRYGLTEEGWKPAPLEPIKPHGVIGIQLEATNYELAKKKFEEEMNRFREKAKVLFEQNVSKDEIKSLSEEIQKFGFKLENLVKPVSIEEAAKKSRYELYTSDDLDDAINQSTRYEQM